MDKNDYIFDQEDFILYILNKIEPKNSTKIKLNKIAFFTEFGFLYRENKQLSNADYAGINYGPIIDNYAKLLVKMSTSKKITVDGITVRPLIGPSKQPPEWVSQLIDPLIEKYSNLSTNEIVTLSHETDSYKITTMNEQIMGNIIDKDLAQLETFYSDELTIDELDTSSSLPQVNSQNLETYVLG